MNTETSTRATYYQLQSRTADSMWVVLNSRMTNDDGAAILADLRAAAERFGPTTILRAVVPGVDGVWGNPEEILAVRNGEWVA
jgi:hypothetical protein